MSIVEIQGGPLTRRSLMNKSKSDLAHLVLTYCDLLERKGLPFPFRIELEMAVRKHPQAEWEEMQPSDMHGELLREVDELKSALWAGELNGEHGIIREAVHVQVVAHRIIDEMRRRHR